MWAPGSYPMSTEFKYLGMGCEKFVLLTCEHFIFLKNNKIWGLLKGQVGWY